MFSKILKALAVVATLVIAVVAALFFSQEEQTVALVGKAQFHKPSGVPYPEHNPFTREKFELGKALFFDKSLSNDGRLSCASCHDPEIAWQSDLTQHANNITVIGRKAPTIENLAWSEEFTWDGRAKSLEIQATLPMFNPIEMATSERELLSKIQSSISYQKLFAAAFPKQQITLSAVTQAIATFERTIVTKSSPFDRWLAGDKQAISETAKLGFDLFVGKARCAQCHKGWRLTDDGFHDTGLKNRDIGRFKFDQKSPRNKFAFKTPGLRNIAKRAPYMHDGSLKDLRSVIKFYQDEFVKRPSLSPEMKALELTESEVSALVAFMETLSDDHPVIADPSPLLGYN